MLALGILNRVKQPGWLISLVAPTSMNGVTLRFRPA